MSTVTFVRRQMKVRGQSQHNGRGMYECSAEGAAQEELFNRAKKLIDVWEQKGLVSKKNVTDEWISVTFDKDKVNGGDAYYCNFTIGRRAGPWAGWIVTF